MEILKTLVGSRAHGTNLPESDYDFRGVFVAEPLEFFSPFRDVKTTQWIEGDEDNTSYELTHFCKLCASGNPSGLELLVAPIIYASDEGMALRDLLPAFISKKCIPAFIGYSRNQEKKFRDNALGRRWKYAEAHTRTLYQLRHLLKTGELKIGWDGGILEELCHVKRGLRTQEEVMGRIFDLEKECEELAATNPAAIPDLPDIKKIEEFIVSIYLPQDAVQICKTAGSGEVGGEEGKGTPEGA
jgi:hypothetical protein